MTENIATQIQTNKKKETDNSLLKSQWNDS